MNDENTQKLFHDFPSFFRGRNDPQKSLMGFGFCCGNGWFNLIYKLCQDIQKCIKFSNRPDNLDDFEVEQVKEKFGGLRFYVGPAIKPVHDLIAKAEGESYKICEVCGESGELVSVAGYYTTRCPTHIKELEEKRNEKAFKC